MRTFQPLEGVAIHETAIVEPGARIGPGTIIWHYSHIRAGATIGRECMLGKGTYIAEAASLGNGVRVQNGVSVYNGVTLEDYVFVGPSVVFTNDMFPRAESLAPPDLRPTRIRRGASLGAGSVIVCGIEIGTFAMVGAGAVVIADVPANACVVGNPAIQIGWSCRCGRTLVPHESLPQLYRCPTCDRQYHHRATTQSGGSSRRLIGALELEFQENDRN